MQKESILDTRITYKQVTRRCTDVLYLLIFLVLTVGAGVLIYYAIMNSNPNLLKHGMDADGNFCGFTPGYKNYPYAYYANINTSNWFPYATCVTSCPTESQQTVSCTGNGNQPAVGG